MVQKKEKVEMKTEKSLTYNVLWPSINAPILYAMFIQNYIEFTVVRAIL